MRYKDIFVTKIWSKLVTAAATAAAAAAAATAAKTTTTCELAFYQLSDTIISRLVHWISFIGSP